MNIKIGILNVSKHCNKHDLIHFVTSGEPAQSRQSLHSSHTWSMEVDEGSYQTSDI